MPKQLFTKENAKEKGRKAGIKSGEVRREKRDIRNACRLILEMPVADAPIEDYNSLEESKGKNKTIAEAIIMPQVVKAIKGDKQSAEWLFKQAGLTPDQNININAEVTENKGYLNSITKQLIDYRKTIDIKKEDE